MKTCFIVLLALGSICGFRSAAAQEPVSLTFSNQLNKESETVRSMAELQQIKAWEVLVTGKIAGRSYSLQTVHCVDGKEQRSTEKMSRPAQTDTLRLLFFTQTIGQDSVRMLINTPCEKKESGYAVQDARSCILLEPFPEKELTTADAIPVIAFCQGAPTDFPLPDGTTAKGISYCNVRDGHLHPSKWHERFKLKDYIYFEIKFADPPTTRK